MNEETNDLSDVGNVLVGLASEHKKKSFNEQTSNVQNVKQMNKKEIKTQPNGDTASVQHTEENNNKDKNDITGGQEGIQPNNENFTNKKNQQDEEMYHLNGEFEEESSTKSKSTPKKALLDGIRISLIGTFENTQQGLVKMIRNHGGIARQGLTTLFNTKKDPTTHIVTNNEALKTLGDGFVKRVSKHKNMQIVSEQWIVDTIAKGRVLEESSYPVPGVEEALEALKQQPDSDEDNNDSDYIETHVRKRKKHALDTQPRKRRNSRRAHDDDIDIDDGITLLIETEARESENERVMRWTPEQVQEWFEKTLNIDDEDMEQLVDWVIKEKIDGEVMLELDNIEDLKALGFKIGVCMKIKKAVKKFKSPIIL